MADQLPTFIVIGAPKAGTTSLASYLEQHPDVFMSHPKEPAHFTGRGPYADIDRYLALFGGAEPRQARGEASTGYSRYPVVTGVPRRMHDLVPEVRLVYLVRDPLERLRSHYLMRLRQGATGGSFEEFCSDREGYVAVSCYGAQLAQYLEFFEPTQIHLARLEDLGADPGRVLRGIAAHIGVDPVPFDADLDYATRNTAPAGGARRYPAVPRGLRRLTRFVPGDLRERVKARLPQRSVGEDDLVLSSEAADRLRSRFADDQRQVESLVGSKLYDQY